ncbi:unnamed protein product [marine sediment metagenome]|uniref:HEPN domain-containing protein n=1 Tax=marine sediment metagenome TaxID=412755 RepID=X0YNR4_9ZZZZ
MSKVSNITKALEAAETHLIASYDFAEKVDETVTVYALQSIACSLHAIAQILLLKYDLVGGDNLE